MQAWISAGNLQREVAPRTSSLATGSVSNFFDEHASLALLHRHFGLSLYGSSPRSFCLLLSLLGVTVRAPVGSGGRAQLLQWAQAKEVYKKSFAEYAARHRTVAKFVSLSAKHLQPVNPFCVSFACVSGSGLSAGQMHEMGLIPTDPVDPVPLPQVHRIPIPRGIPGAIAGFVALRRSSSVQSSASASASGDEWYALELSHMCVDFACRSRGIGTLLLAAAIAYAKQCDPLPQQIVLSVMTELTAAMALYAKAGFCHDGPPVASGTCFLQKLVYHMP